MVWVNVGMALATRETESRVAVGVGRALLPLRSHIHKTRETVTADTATFRIKKGRYSRQFALRTLPIGAHHSTSGAKTELTLHR